MDKSTRKLLICVIFVTISQPMYAAYATDAHVEPKKAESESIHLDWPGVMSLYSKLSTAILWGNKLYAQNSTLTNRDGFYWCNPMQAQEIIKCGGKQLMDIWMSTKPKSKEKAQFSEMTQFSDKTQNRLTYSSSTGQVTGGEYKYMIDEICRKYQLYNTCLSLTSSSEDLKTCTSLTLIGVQALFGFICRPAAVSAWQEVGECLAQYTTEEVTTHSRLMEGCHDDNFSGFVELMMGAFKVADISVTQSKAGVKHYMQSLCAEWSKFKRCYISSVANFCGARALSLYEGLLKHMQEILVNVFRPLGETFVENAQCKFATIGQIDSQDMTTYVREELKMWDQAYTTAVMDSCTCSGWSTMQRALYCFWKSVYVHNLSKLSFTNFTFARLLHLLCGSTGVLHHFNQCYHGAVGHCAISALLNYTDIAHTMCIAMEAANHNQLCMLELTLGNTYLKRCDLTLPHFLEYIILQATTAYRIQVGKCFPNSGTISGYPQSDCTRSAVKEMIEAPDKNQFCVNDARRKIVAGLQRFMNVVGEAHDYFGEVFKFCLTTFPECNG